MASWHATVFSISFHSTMKVFSVWDGQARRNWRLETPSRASDEYCSLSVCLSVCLPAELPGFFFFILFLGNAAQQVTLTLPLGGEKNSQQKQVVWGHRIQSPYCCNYITSSEGLMLCEVWHVRLTNQQSILYSPLYAVCSWLHYLQWTAGGSITQYSSLLLLLQNSDWGRGGLMGFVCFAVVL